MLLPLKKLLPRRPGIAWAAGARLEAMDYMQKWYPAKIVDVDEDEQKVLIHFDGWNSRFDEWVTMRSERVRALGPTHANDRTQKDKVICTFDFKIGDQVLAKWADGSPFPAEVCGLMDDGTIEVKYFDGQRKLVRPSKLQLLPDQLKNEVIAVMQFMTSTTKADEISGAEGSRLSRREALLAKRAEKEARESIDLKLKALAEKAARVLRDDSASSPGPATLAAASSSSTTTVATPSPLAILKQPSVDECDTAAAATSADGSSTAAGADEAVGGAGSASASASKAECLHTLSEAASSKRKRRSTAKSLDDRAATPAASPTAVAAAATPAADSIADSHTLPSCSQPVDVASAVGAPLPASADDTASTAVAVGVDAATATSVVLPTIAASPTKSSIGGADGSGDGCRRDSADVSQPLLPQQQQQGRKPLARRTGSARERPHRSGGRLLVAGIFKARGGPSRSIVRSRTGSSVTAAGGSSSESQKAKRRRWRSGGSGGGSSSRHRHGRDRSHRSHREADDSAEEAAAFAAIAAATSSAVSGRKRKCTLAPDMALAVVAHELESPEEEADAGASGALPTAAEEGAKARPAAAKRRARSESGNARKALKQQQRRLSGRKRSAFFDSVEACPGASAIDGSTAAHHHGYVTSSEPVIATKAFKVEEDHNHFKCIYEGCDKSFRKESLLAYHVKYYHLTDEPDDVAPVAAGAGKVSAVRDTASTDSDISVGGGEPSPTGVRQTSSAKLLVSRRSSSRTKASIRFRGSRLRRHGIRGPAQSRVPPLPVVPQQAEGLNALPSDLDEMLDYDVDEVFSDSSQDMPTKPACEGPFSQELINCICGFSEEEGLMIQCDTCLRWQHAACFHITKETLPSKYVCFLCHDSPGIRTSCECVDNYEFFTAGRLPCFCLHRTAISSGDIETSAANLKSSHDLVAKMLRVQTIMTSVKKELCVLRTNDKQELTRWRLPSMQKQGRDAGRSAPVVAHGRSANPSRSELGTSRHLLATSVLPLTDVVTAGIGNKNLWSNKASCRRIAERRKSSSSRGGPPGHAQAGRMSSTELGQCRAALLEAAQQAQDSAQEQLDGLEQQMIELERAVGLRYEARDGDPDLRGIKKTLSSLINDVDKVTRIACLSA